MKKFWSSIILIGTVYFLIIFIAIDIAIISAKNDTAQRTWTGVDNLGNHTATEDLKMQGFKVNNMSTGTVLYGDGSNVTGISAETLGGKTSDFFAVKSDVYESTHTNKVAIDLNLSKSSATIVYVNKNLLADTTAPYLSSSTIDGTYQKELSTPSWKATFSKQADTSTYSFNSGTSTYSNNSGTSTYSDNSGKLSGKTYDAFLSTAGGTMSGNLLLGNNDVSGIKDMSANYLEVTDLDFTDSNGERITANNVIFATITCPANKTEVVINTNTKTNGDAEITGKTIVSSITSSGNKVFFDNKNLDSINIVNAFNVHSDTHSGGDSDNWTIPLWLKNVWTLNFDPKTSSSYIQFKGNKTADVWDGFWVGYGSDTTGAWGQLDIVNSYLSFKMSGDKKWVVPAHDNQYKWGIPGKSFAEGHFYELYTTTINPPSPLTITGGMKLITPEANILELGDNSATDYYILFKGATNEGRITWEEATLPNGKFVMGCGFEVDDICAKNKFCVGSSTFCPHDFDVDSDSVSIDGLNIVLKDGAKIYWPDGSVQVSSPPAAVDSVFVTITMRSAESSQGSDTTVKSSTWEDKLETTGRININTFGGTASSATFNTVCGFKGDAGNTGSTISIRTEITIGGNTANGPTHTISATDTSYYYFFDVLGVPLTDLDDGPITGRISITGDADPSGDTVYYKCGTSYLVIDITK